MTTSALIDAVESGDPKATEELISTLYAELRRLAASQLARERPGHTLQPTALVNEAYLRLVGEDRPWENSRHFFGAACEAMRRVLVDHARKRKAGKRGGGEYTRVTLDGLDLADPESAIDCVDVSDSLEALNTLDPRLAKLVELRYFTGLSIEQTAVVLGISEATVKRDWMYARAWLADRLGLGR